MPKKKTKRPSRRYAGPYWISTRNGKPSYHRFDPRLVAATQSNESTPTGNAASGSTKGIYIPCHIFKGTY